MVSITIAFEFHDSNYLSQNDQEFLSLKHTLIIDPERDKMRDLLVKVMKHLEHDNDVCIDDNLLWNRFYLNIDGTYCEINLDFPVINVFRSNATNNVLYIVFSLNNRGGWGAFITDLVKLYIPSSEKGHEWTPHIHVQKGKYNKRDPHKNTIRINLSDLSIMDGAERKASKLFSDKEWNVIMSILKEKQSVLIDNYNKMLRGALPEDIEVELSSGTYYLGSDKYGYRKPTPSF